MLDLEMEFKKGILFVKLIGVINGDTSNYFDDNLTAIVRDNGIRFLSLNFKDVSYIDKYGINILIKAYQYLQTSDGKMFLTNIDHLFNSDISLLDNLYSFKDENFAYEVSKI